MTTETIKDVKSYVPLSPSSLLTMKSKVVMPPPRSFGAADTYCRKRWRRTQHIKKIEQDGARSSFRHYKNKHRAEGNEETFRRETLLF